MSIRRVRILERVSTMGPYEANATRNNGTNSGRRKRSDSPRITGNDAPDKYLRWKICSPLRALGADPIQFFQFIFSWARALTHTESSSGAQLMVVSFCVSTRRTLSGDWKSRVDHSISLALTHAHTLNSLFNFDRTYFHAKMTGN